MSKDEKLEDAFLALLDAVEAGIVKFRMDLGKQTVQPKFVGADEYASKLDWEQRTAVESGKVYELSPQKSGEAFEGLKALIKLAGGKGLFSKTANYWLMFNETQVARRKKEARK